MPSRNTAQSPFATESLCVFAGSGFDPAPPAQKVTDQWRAWIAENILVGTPHEAIVKAMAENGFDRQDAMTELRAALAHPYVGAAAKLGRSMPHPSANLENKLKKRDWILEIYRRTSRQASTFGQIPRVGPISGQQFIDEYYSRNQPVVIESALRDWPAMTEWTSENLKRRFGDRIVEVQANRNTDANYEINQQKLKQFMPFGEFVDITDSAGQTNNWYMTANNSGRNKEALAELWNDISLTEYQRDEPENRGFFWFGPAGTITPLHHDLTNNFMAQVRGRKLIRLIAPCELPDIYNHRHCFSRVDLDHIDFEKFPQFKNVRVIDVEIGPGDLFFLPVGWWHHVRALDISITMTFTNFAADNDFYSIYSTYDGI